jgi:hypothetical protein
MNKEFIPYEQALELKELGFNEECFGFYTLEGCYFPNTTELNSLSYACASPLYQQAFRWFREKYDLFISITHYENGYSINDLRRFDTYEEVENACIDKLIELAKQQDNGNI